MQMSNLIFYSSRCFLDPAIRVCTLILPITAHSALLLGVAMTDQFLHVSSF